MHIFGELAHIFGELVHIFARKLVSRTSKQVSKNLGPLRQPGVYNDTNSYGIKGGFEREGCRLHVYIHIYIYILF